MTRSERISLDHRLADDWRAAQRAYKGARATKDGTASKTWLELREITTRMLRVECGDAG